MAFFDTYTHLTTLEYSDGTSIKLPVSSFQYRNLSSLKNAVEFTNDMHNLAHAAGATHGHSTILTDDGFDTYSYAASPERKGLFASLRDVLAGLG